MLRPRQVSVSGGHLHLQLITKSETCNGKHQQYASGVVTTEGKFSFTYGYLETRVWLPGHHAVTDCSPSPDAPSSRAYCPASATSSQRGWHHCFVAMIVSWPPSPDPSGQRLGWPYHVPR